MQAVGRESQEGRGWGRRGRTSKKDRFVGSYYCRLCSCRGSCHGWAHRWEHRSHGSLYGGPGGLWAVDEVHEIHGGQKQGHGVEWEEDGGRGRGRNTLHSNHQSSPGSRLSLRDRDSLHDSCHDTGSSSEEELHDIGSLRDSFHDSWNNSLEGPCGIGSLRGSFRYILSSSWVCGDRCSLRDSFPRYILSSSYQSCGSDSLRDSLRDSLSSRRSDSDSHRDSSRDI